LKSSVSSVSSQSFSHCATSSFSSFSLVHSVFVCVEVKRERERDRQFLRAKQSSEKKRERRDLKSSRYDFKYVIYNTFFVELLELVVAL
jgi:hypothetical protein